MPPRLEAAWVLFPRATAPRLLSVSSDGGSLGVLPPTQYRLGGPANESANGEPAKRAHPGDTRRDCSAAEGIHLGAMAGTIDMALRCFTGMRARGETLRLIRPCL